MCIYMLLIFSIFVDTSIYIDTRAQYSSLFEWYLECTIKMPVSFDNFKNNLISC